MAQQLVSAPVFDALFSDYQFIRNNPISKSLEKLLARLDENIDKKDRETLDRFYETVRHKASDKTTAVAEEPQGVREDRSDLAGTCESSP